MSTAVHAPMGQAPPTDAAAPAPTGRENPQTLVQESIKYRRRAQEAERRAEALEAEIEALREGRDDRTSALEADLTQARSEADALRGRLDGLDRDRRLERAFVQAGCGDPEVALAVARERLAGGAPPEDLAGFAASLLEEKPHLRGGAPVVPARIGAAASGAAALPPPSAAPRPAADAAPRRAAERLADQARRSGNPADVMAYMKARRGRTEPRT